MRKVDPKKPIQLKKPDPVKKIEVGKPKFHAQNYLRPGISLPEINEIKEAFDLFDTDLSGSIDIKQLKAAMTSLGFQRKNTVVFQMICDLDEDGTGQIEFGEWFDLMTNRVHDKNTRLTFHKLFLLFDDERTGGITVKNLRRVCQQIGEAVEESQLHQMIQRAGLQNQDSVSEEEFYTIMTRKILTK